MNAGFEDCSVLMETLETNNFDFHKSIHAFQETRIKDANAISDLALKNFIEMRDKVADEEFLRRKLVEAQIHKLYPDDWVPQYSMVTFSNYSYSQAFEYGLMQDEVMNRYKDKWLNNDLNNEDLKQFVDDFKNLRKDA